MPTQAMVDPSLLRPNPWNSNLVSPENEAKLVESIRRLGCFKPIVVREIAFKSKTEPRYEILGGEHRWQGVTLLGQTEIPIFNLGKIDDETAKKISLADNARYGADDTIRLAEMLEGMEDGKDVAEFLPFTDADLTAIFSSVNIALDELELDGFEEGERKPEEAPIEKAPKTHTIMRFKIPIGDAERITELLTKVQKRQGFSGSDELTNAGDALVHQLLGAAE